MEKRARQAGNAFLWQAIQTGGNKLIFFIRILVLARLLTPNDFGLVAIATTAMGVFQNISDVGLIPALVQGKEIRENDYDSAWSVGIIRASIISIVMVAAAPYIASVFDEPQAIPFIRIFGLYPLLQAVASIKIVDLNRNLLFRPLAILKLTESLVTTVVSILVAVFWGVWGLVIGSLAGVAVMGMLSYLLAPHKPRFFFDSESIKPLIRFGRWIFITSLTAMIGGTILRIVITRQLGASALGLYYLATQFAYLPSEISSGVVGAVAFPMFSSLRVDIENTKRAFRAIVIGTAALLYPACLLIIVLAPEFVNEMLGSKWQGTETVIQILSLATLIGIFGDYVVEIIKGMGRPDQRFLMVLVQVSVLIVLVWIFTGWFGLPGAALASIPAVLVSQILGIGFIRQLIPNPFKGLSWPIGAILITSLTSAALAFFIDRSVSGIVGIVSASIVASLSYVIGLWILNRRRSLGLSQTLAQIFPKYSGVLKIPFLGEKN